MWSAVQPLTVGLGKAIGEVTTAVPMAIPQKLLTIHTRKRGEQDAWKGGQTVARGWGRWNYLKSVF